MRRFLFVFSALVLSLSVALFPGCGGEDGEKNNPAGPGESGDTLTTEDVLSEIEDVMGSVQVAYEDCDPYYVLAGLPLPENLPEIGLLVAAIDSAMGNGGDLSPFYGTWQDTTPFRPLDGPVRIGAEPSHAVRIVVIGLDTLGGQVPGTITLHEFFGGESTDSVRVSVSVHADASPNDSLWILIKGEMSEAAGAGDVKLWAHSCGAECFLEIEVAGQDGEASISGWYAYPGEATLHFSASGSVDTTMSEGGVEGTLHLWTTEDPEFDLTVTMVDDPDTCLYGTIKIDGSPEAEIYMVNCDDEEAVAVYMVVDGHAFDAEEMLGEFYELLFTMDLDELEQWLEYVPEKRNVPEILWPVGKGHAEALERYRQ
ncbi:MAG: hypothetical protein ABIH26_15495 [Candidatus Eisenbacteria bacterium]